MPKYILITIVREANGCYLHQRREKDTTPWIPTEPRNVSHDDLKFKHTGSDNSCTFSLQELDGRKLVSASWSLARIFQHRHLPRTHTYILSIYTPTQHSNPFFFSIQEFSTAIFALNEQIIQIPNDQQTHVMNSESARNQKRCGALHPGLRRCRDCLVHSAIT